ncbi:Aminomethyltransferase folate-binding domain-containing protein [Mycena maculata]|uniref:Aminomethyltransferase folate-binding domain-containing protein n=1 Tax=Mycena maculata TaxID=230809 RepID=A0AAD7IJC9_9AGAR|nr:Aminomethyltransferase folate-binding domain-containing protein [Mycena maculata]
MRQSFMAARRPLHDEDIEILLMPPPLQGLIQKIPTVARIPHRSVLSLAGSQAPEFLNGILSTLVHSSPRPFYSAFLHAQGRVLYDVFVYTRTNPAGQRGYLIDYDSRPSEAPPLLDLIKRYILRSRVKVRDVSDEYDVWGVWGSPGEEEVERHWKWAESSGVAEPAWNTVDEWPWGSQDEMIRDQRAPGMGKRLLVRKGDRPPDASSHDLATSDAYTLHRILRGVPEGSTDIPAMQAFPMDSNLDFMGGLDFRKGCYVGQELTVRTYHTGIIRKRIMPVVIHPPDSSPPKVVAPSQNLPSFASGLDIRGVANQPTGHDNPTPRPRGNGKLLSSSNGLGLALLRLEQVEAAEQGKLAFSMDVETDGTKVSWGVSHWRPDWWPRRVE